MIPFIMFCPKNCRFVVIFAFLLLRPLRTVWPKRLKFRVIDLKVGIHKPVSEVIYLEIPLFLPKTTRRRRKVVLLRRSTSLSPSIACSRQQS